jgi:hypothetical protein
LSSIATLALVAAFLVADRQTLHWYTAQPVPTPTATPQVPDRVVGVVEKCDPVDAGAARELAYMGCAELATVEQVVNHRLEVTVRTSSGGSYVVTVKPDTRVKVGDRWPK